MVALPRTNLFMTLSTVIAFDYGKQPMRLDLMYQKSKVVR